MARITIQPDGPTHDTELRIRLTEIVAPAALTLTAELDVAVATAIGGTPGANAAARVTAWRRSIEFLQEHLRRFRGL